MLIARDSTDPFAIPLDGLNSAWGYGDGAFVWPSSGWARFQPPIVPLSIVVSPLNVGDILDVETGDATPADCPGWNSRFSRPGRRAATFYCSRTTWPLIVNALGLSVARKVDFIVATLDGSTDAWYGSPGTSPPDGLRLVAIQQLGSAQTGGNYDQSVILDPTWIFPPVPFDGGLPDMSSTAGPTTSDSFFAGFFAGQPAASGYYNRDVWVACAADLALPGAQFPVQLRVYFVPFNYTSTGPSPDVHSITLEGSQEVSVRSSLVGEQSIRIEHVSGGPYIARAYHEFIHP